MDRNKIFDACAKLSCLIVAGICIWHMSVSAATIASERQTVNIAVPEPPVEIEIISLPTPTPALSPSLSSIIMPTPTPITRTIVKYNNTYVYSTPDKYIYQVRPGDTLSVIAGVFGVDIDWLAAVNGIIDMDDIEVGQMIRIPKD